MSIKRKYCRTKEQLDKKYIGLFFSFVYESKNRCTWTLKCYKGQNLNESCLVYEVKETNPLMGQLMQIRKMDKYLMNTQNDNK